MPSISPDKLPDVASLSLSAKPFYASPIQALLDEMYNASTSDAVLDGAKKVAEELKKGMYNRLKPLYLI